ncbi:hypothetical protein CXB51_003065 [Gossypium anomalum]|uniref:Uncharacterized protein n=1 Tax=Gossypium anomalum TaxID=47600 RepID=A0A8J6D740_9ROSI|nr:hypothetical protein CXB51_003065 [Gossypium anomalum]
MEADFAGLTLDEEEDAVLQVQVGANTDREVGAYGYGKKEKGSEEETAGEGKFWGIICGKESGNLSGNQMHTLMEHDLEDGVLIGEEGKKKNRREIEDVLAKEQINTLAVRNRRVVEVSHQSSAAAKRQANRAQ